MDISNETFQLFVVSAVIDRIRVVIVIFLTLLTVSATNGFLRFKMKKLMPGLVISVVVTSVRIVGIYFLLEKGMQNILATGNL